MGESIITTLNTIYSTQASSASADAAYIAGIVRIASGIGALLYIFGHLVTQIASNQEINFMPFLRPFIILMVIPFSGAITTAIDGVGNQIQARFNSGSKNIAVHVTAINNEMKKKVDQKWEDIRNDPKAYQAVFGTDKTADEAAYFGFGETITSLKISIAQAQESFKFQMFALIQEILLALMYIAEAALYLFSIMYRLVLRMGFPIAVCLCIFPGFTSNLAHWFGKYINFALLPAVASMYTNICFKLLLTYLQNYNTAEALADMGAETAQPEYMGLAFIAIMIMCLLGYTQIPSMTSMLISVGGVSAIAAAATRTAQNYGNKGIKAGENVGNNVGGKIASAGATLNSYTNAGMSGAKQGAAYGASVGGSTASKVGNMVKGSYVGAGLGMADRFKNGAKKS
jgi:hypothetical protein